MYFHVYVSSPLRATRYFSCELGTTVILQCKLVLLLLFYYVTRQRKGPTALPGHVNKLID